MWFKHAYIHKCSLKAFSESANSRLGWWKSVSLFDTVTVVYVTWRELLQVCLLWLKCVKIKLQKGKYSDVKKKRFWRLSLGRRHNTHCTLWFCTALLMWIFDRGFLPLTSCYTDTGLTDSSDSSKERCMLSLQSWLRSRLRLGGALVQL